MANLYIVGTPIGNLGDITFRAIEILKKVDLILCEDTRQTKKLLNKYNISNNTLSYHSQSKLSKLDKIISLLKEGKDLALVSDAGTPTISDPGFSLIQKIKNELEEVKIIPIPGASALITALSASSLPKSEFTFLGFLPHKKGRETLFKEIRDSNRTFVFYESPHRIIKTLESLNNICGEKKVCIARELTKIYEEFIEGNPKEILDKLLNNKEKQKGEFTIIVSSN